MEKEGLLQALQFLHDNALTIGILVTDRHKQINKFMSLNYSDVEHCYDVWYVAKGNSHITVCSIIISKLGEQGLKKKLQKAAKYKYCEVVGEWTKSITNHMHWCEASSPDSNGEEMEIFNWTTFVMTIETVMVTTLTCKIGIEMANTRYDVMDQNSIH